MRRIILVISIGAALLGIEPAGAAAGYVPHRLIVRYAASASAGERAELRAEIGAVHGMSLGGSDTVVYSIGGGESVPEALRAARASEAVVYAEPDRLYRAAAVPDDPEFPTQWALQNTGLDVEGQAGTPGADIGAVRAWDITTGTPSTVVAVIDTGITYDHEDLAAHIFTNPGETGTGKEINRVDDDEDGYIDDWHGWDFINQDDDATDTSGHGTGMAGVIGASTNNGLGMAGVDWNAILMPLRASINEVSFDGARVAAAINYAADHGASVANLSFSGPYSAAIKDALALHPELLAVAAAGNEGVSEERFPCALTSPNLLCVASSDNQDHLMPYSNYGAQVDLAAPGLSIVLTVAGPYPYNSGSGTSVATALTSGAAALMRSYLPGWSAAQIRQRILDTVDPLPGLANVVVSGGRLDVGNALDFVAPDTTISPDPPALIEDATPSLSFTSNESDVGFECQLDGGLWSPCASGAPLDPIPDGPHAVAVRAVDGGRNFDQSPETASFTIAAPGPTTTIDSAPSPLSNAGTASFTYSSADAVRFECSIDGGSWKACQGSGVSYAGLKDGAHFFSVRGYDDEDEVEPAPPSVAFAIDLTPPQTVIDTGPPSLLSSSTVAFTYSSEPDASFECRLDGASFGPCPGTGQTLAGLGDGGHTFAVRAVDPAGNADPSPATRGFQVDTVGPAVEIDTFPPKESESTTARFSYSSPETVSGFRCGFEGATPGSCNLGNVTYTGLAPGGHVFTVSAVDPAGNTGPPAAYSFTVRAPVTPKHVRKPPVTKLLRMAPERSTRRTVIFTFGGGTEYRFRFDGERWQRTGRAHLVLHPKPGPHRLKVIAIDSEGADPTPLVYRFATLKPRPR